MSVGCSVTLTFRVAWGWDPFSAIPTASLQLLRHNALGWAVLWELFPTCQLQTHPGSNHTPSPPTSLAEGTVSLIEYCCICLSASPQPWSVCPTRGPSLQCNLGYRDPVSPSFYLTLDLVSLRGDLTVCVRMLPHASLLLSPSPSFCSLILLSPSSCFPPGLLHVGIQVPVGHLTFCVFSPLTLLVCSPSVWVP